MSCFHNRVIFCLRKMSWKTVLHQHQPKTYSYLSWCRRNVHSQHARQHISNSHESRGNKGKLEWPSVLLRRETNFKFLSSRSCSSSAIFNSDQDSNASNFEFDHGLEDSLSEVDKMKSNISRRGLSIDIDKLVCIDMSYYYYTSGVLIALQPRVPSQVCLIKCQQ